MTTFQNNPEELLCLDWSILQNGWTSLYWKTEVSENDLAWFGKEKYALVDFNCNTWTEEKKMHTQLKQKLNFPDYYGEIFDALNDCLSHIEILNTGQIVTFRHLDNFRVKRPHLLLDVFANNSRRHILFGKRLIVLAQVDNADYQIAPVGATPVMWNGAEWFDSKRR